jgi:uncharacterized membrane protein
MDWLILLYANAFSRPLTHEDRQPQNIAIFGPLALCAAALLYMHADDKSLWAFAFFAFVFPIVILPLATGLIKESVKMTKVITAFALLLIFISLIFAGKHIISFGWFIHGLVYFVLYCVYLKASEKSAIEN